MRPKNNRTMSWEHTITTKMIKMVANYLLIERAMEAVLRRRKKHAVRVDNNRYPHLLSHHQLDLMTTK